MPITALISGLIGMLLTEIAVRNLGHPWTKAQLKSLQKHLGDFLATTDDDQRQAIALRSGWMTLRLSLASFLLLALLGALAILPPWALNWSAEKLQLYTFVTSVSATLWWLLRHRICALLLRG